MQYKLCKMPNLIYVRLTVISTPTFMVTHYTIELDLTYFDYMCFHLFIHFRT